MPDFKLGSLFSGAGGFEFAAQICGIEPVWASEIETFPIAVTTKRFPNMKHLGDVSKINGAEIEPVDIITFGSPCQDLSVAGKRAGLEGERSGLFMQAIRIIKEMRSATNGRYPTIAVWENVPGAFSSAKGEDFRAVLEAFCQVVDENADVPRPANGKWSYAGEIVGDGYSVAWRVLDAQYWGVPQRRRRVFLVADFRGGRAGEILFKREGLSRNFAESRASWQGITKSLAFRTPAEEREAVHGEHGICSYESNSMKSANPSSGFYEADTSRTLDCNGGNPSCNQGDIAIVAIEGNGSRPSHRGDGYSEDPVSYTLNSVDRHAVCCLNPEDPQTARIYSANGVWHSLNANSGGGQSRDAVFAFACNQRDEVRLLGDKAGAIQAQPGMKQQTFLAVFDARGNGDGLIAPNITGDHENRVTDYTAVVVGVNGDTAGTLDASYFKGTGARNGKERDFVLFAIGNGQTDQLELHEIPGALNCMHDQQSILVFQAAGDRDNPTISVSDKAFCIPANAMSDRGQAVLCVAPDRAAYNQGQNAQFDPGIDGENGKAFTVIAKGPGAVCYAVNRTVGAVCATDYKGIRNQDIDQGKYVCYTVDMGGGKTGCGIHDNQSPTLACTHGGEPVTVYLTPIEIILRRLTPTECARLQGMPDWWCDDVPHSDSAEYKMWGNGMALPCVLYVMEGVAKYLTGIKEENDGTSD